MWLYVSTSSGVLYSKQITVQTGKSVFRQPLILFSFADSVIIYTRSSNF